MMGPMRVTVVILIVALNAWANAPAPWAVCAGKKAGDSCSGMYYPFGRCVVDDFACRESPTCLTCRSRGGCEVGEGPAAAGAALLGAVTLLLLIRRRAARPRGAP
jgi:MYXO-CTERM domain-containing protein